MVFSLARFQDQRTRHRLLFAILLLATFLVRLVVILKTNAADFGDAQEYLDGARRVLGGQTLAYKNDYFFVRAPGYALFLAGAWALSGTRSVLVLQLVQLPVAVATSAYVIALARRLSDKPHVALWAGLAAALYPYHVQSSTVVGAEALSMLLVAAATYHLVRGLAASPEWAQVLLGSFSFAIAILVRPNIATALPFLLLFIMWHYRRNLWASLLTGSMLVAAVVVVALPWSIAVHKQGLGWMFMTDGFGASYFFGHSTNAERLYCASTSDQERTERLGFGGIDTFNKTPEYALAKTLPGPQQDDVFLRSGLNWDRAHLGTLPCLFVMKVVHFWRPWVDPLRYSRSSVAVSLLALPILLIGTFGLGLALRRTGSTLAGMAICHALAATLSAGLIHATIRYRTPIVDLLWMPFFGYGLVEMVALLRRGYRNGEQAQAAAEVNG
jgi:4-amino-4-deoxy-L-arabinose transferase-like glycosyltransferase